MIFNDLPMLTMMTKKLSWLSQRTEMLAQNIANVDTPGFKARDMKDVSFRELVAKQQGQVALTGAPRLTNASHMRGTVAVRVFKDERMPDRSEAALDGNTVSAEQQMLKLGETQAAHQMTLNLYRKQLNMLRTAIGRGSA